MDGEGKAWSCEHQQEGVRSILGAQVESRAWWHVFINPGAGEAETGD